MFALVGRTAAGKTTTLNELVKAGFKKACTTTTRPMRPGEVDGVDYHFISEEEFLANIEEGVYAEYTVYHAAFGTAFYGSRVDSYVNDDDKTFIILNPRGLRTLRKKGIPVNAIHLDISKEEMLRRLEKRGDSPEEIDRRVREDEPDFADIRALADVEVSVDGKTEKEVAFEVLEAVNAISEEGKKQKTNNLLLDIIEEFEDFLDSKGVRIPNEERDEDDPDNGANFYGDDFEWLMQRLRIIFGQYGIEVDDCWDD